MAGKASAALATSLCLLLTALWILPGASAAESDEFMGSLLEKQKALYSFEEWASRVELPGRSLAALPGLGASLERFGRVSHASTQSSDSKLYRVIPAETAPEEVEVTIRRYGSSLQAKEAILQSFALNTRGGRFAQVAVAGSQHDLGDVCLYPASGPALRFDWARNNVYVRLRATNKCSPVTALEIANVIDAELVRLLGGGELEGSTQPAPRAPSAALQAPAPLRPGEATEALLKAMPEDDARRVCLQKAEEMARNPDESPQELALFLRGLGPDENPPQVAVLRQILRRATNGRVRTETVRMLAQWISGQHETREDVLRDVGRLAIDPDGPVRRTVAHTLGRSGDVRQLPALAAMLEDEDAGVRREAANAVCDLLGWDRVTAAGAEGEAALQHRLEPVLAAIRALDEAIQEPAPAD